MSRFLQIPVLPVYPYSSLQGYLPKVTDIIGLWFKGFFVNKCITIEIMKTNFDKPQFFLRLADVKMVSGDSVSWDVFFIEKVIYIELLKEWFTACHTRVSTRSNIKKFSCTLIKFGSYYLFFLLNDTSICKTEILFRKLH